ncbi:Transmembrane protein [Quillaja saponaria]|uniref:Transmembrane protein n=1 Tax=Quillaja saponaria TaxID=32244 RepID=A0AAD7VHT3_QUISA|nr:Transmembrane protein [Quillaja saponaria]
MDLEEEWEFLPDDGFLDFHEDGEKKILLGKRNSNSKSVLNMNYFICPSPNSRKITESPENSRVPNQLVPVPIRLDLNIGKAQDPDGDLVKEIAKDPIEVTAVVQSEKNKAPNLAAMEADQDTVSQVFFKKMKENEFVDMKMDSPPKSPTRGVLPQIDTGSFHFEDKGETLESKSSPRMKSEKMDCENKEEDNWEESDGGLNLWKWSFTGIGAICSFGVAAATICILFFGSHQRNKQIQQNQKLRFQIYTDDKGYRFLAAFGSHTRNVASSS